MLVKAAEPRYGWIVGMAAFVAGALASGATLAPTFAQTCGSVSASGRGFYLNGSEIIELRELFMHSWSFHFAHGQ